MATTVYFMEQYRTISFLRVLQVITEYSYFFSYCIALYTIFCILMFFFLVFSLSDFISRQMAWIWLLWLLSQTWITIHIWTPKAERLASTEKLFILPMYNGLLIDQSMALNRKRDDQKDVKTEVQFYPIAFCSLLFC